MSNLSCRKIVALEVLFFLGAASVVLSSAVFAGIVLDPIGQQDWDRNANPGGFQVTFGISPNAQPPTENVLNTFSIGLMIVPDSAQNGTLRIQSISIPTNSVFSQYSDLRFSGTTTQVVTGDNQTISAGNNLPRNFELTSQRNIFTALFTSPNNDAMGGFKIFAVPTLSTYFTETSFDGEKFFNAPEGGSPVLLGSFNITAVPEPSSLLLASLVAGGIATLRLRRNRRLANSLEILYLRLDFRRLAAKSPRAGATNSSCGPRVRRVPRRPWAMECNAVGVKSMS